MSVSSHANMKSIRSFETVLLVWCFILFCTAAALLLISAKAHALTHNNLDEMGVRAYTSSPSFSSSESSQIPGDTCKHLLRAAHLDTSPALNHAPQGVAAMDKDRRKAGAIAALGLMLGVRTAIVPSAETESSDIISITPAVWSQAGKGSPAFAVTAYRSCKKQEALREQQDR